MRLWAVRVGGFLVGWVVTDMLYEKLRRNRVKTEGTNA